MSRQLAFAALIWPTIALAQQPSPEVPPSAAGLIPWLLQEKDELRQLPFSDVIFSATGRR